MKLLTFRPAINIVVGLFYHGRTYFIPTIGLDGIED